AISSTMIVQGAWLAPAAGGATRELAGSLSKESRLMVPSWFWRARREPSEVLTSARWRSFLPRLAWTSLTERKERVKTVSLGSEDLTESERTRTLPFSSERSGPFVPRLAS